MRGNGGKYLSVHGEVACWGDGKCLGFLNETALGYGLVARLLYCIGCKVVVLLPGVRYCGRLVIS